jgi:hypothetical protein
MRGREEGVSIPPIVGSLFSWKSLFTKRITREDYVACISRRSILDKADDMELYALPFPPLLLLIEPTLHCCSAWEPGSLLHPPSRESL